MYGTRLMDEFENWHQAPAGGTHLDEWMINVSQAHQRDRVMMSAPGVINHFCKNRS